eukprot:g6190.t1
MLHACIALPVLSDTYQHVVKPIKRMTDYVRKMTEESLSKALLRTPDRAANSLETELLQYSLVQVGLILKRSDELLLELLPQSVLIQLLRGARIIANTFDRVSILYTDLVGFTRIASTMTPKELVTWMNQLYRTFDYCVELNGTYKVETIGDAYIVTAGCPGNGFAPRINARNAAETAIDMLDAMLIVKEFLALDALDMRCGIHTGSVVAGVINKKNPRFHIFGENCTVAAKMESGGVPGRIQMSEATAALVDDMYYSEARSEPVEIMEGKAVPSVLMGRSTEQGQGRGREEKEEQKEHEQKEHEQLDDQAPRPPRRLDEHHESWAQLGARRRDAWRFLLKDPEQLMQKRDVLALLEQTTAS